jgi:hypothetical protein
LGATAGQSAEACLPKALNADATWLWRYESRDWRERLKRKAQEQKFNATLTPLLDREVDKINKIIDLDNERQKRQPVIKHEEPTPEQTGDSRLLGGPMSISSPWNDDDPEPPAAS